MLQQSFTFSFLKDLGVWSLKLQSTCTDINTCPLLCKDTR